jgi:hypothetical protein
LVRGALSARRKTVAFIAFASIVASAGTNVAFSPMVAQGLRPADAVDTRQVPTVSQSASPAIAVADALLWGRPMPPATVTADLPSDERDLLASYRRREATFRSTLTPPPRATAEEAVVFATRVGIERVVFSLFDRRESARVAAMYALDADVGFTQPGFADVMLRGLTQKWLAPYLNLVAGDLRVCVGRETEGRRQLIAARDGGHPLIKLIAEQLLEQKRCFDEIEQ